MTAIKEILPQIQKDKQENKQLSVVYNKPLQNAIIKTRDSYGDAESFALTFNVNIQIKVAKNIERAYLGDAPSLSIVCKAYNEEFLVAWLMAQLENINDFCGVKMKMSERQLEEVAEIISVEYYYLKVTELHLFLHRFKAGRYGQFYGVIDALKITESLIQFSQERLTDIRGFERERRKIEDEQKRAEWEENAVTREEYEQIKLKEQ